MEKTYPLELTGKQITLAIASLVRARLPGAADLAAQLLDSSASYGEPEEPSLKKGVDFPDPFRDE